MLQRTIGGYLVCVHWLAGKWTVSEITLKDVMSPSRILSFPFVHS